MDLAYDPNRTFVRGINKHKQKHMYLYQKDRGAKNFWKTSRKKVGNI